MSNQSGRLDYGTGIAIVVEDCRRFYDALEATIRHGAIAEHDKARLQELLRLLNIGSTYNSTIKN